VTYGLCNAFFEAVNKLRI